MSPKPNAIAVRRRKDSGQLKHQSPEADRWVFVLDALDLTYIERIFMYRTRSGRRETPTAMAKTAIAPRTIYSPRIEPPCILLMVVDPAFLNVQLLRLM
jgi:hypothetical protein